MRRKEREITDIREIEEIIGKARVCRIAFADGNEPYIVPVFFGYEDRTLYIHSAREGRKLDMLRRNNRVCFEIDADVDIIAGEKACQFSAKYRSVIGTGKARILKENEEKSRALQTIVKHYSGGEFTFTEAELDKVLVWKIEIEQFSGKKAGY